MGWLTDNDDESQKLRNLLMFKFYGTDKEMEDAGPFFLIILGIIAVIGLLIWIF